MRRSIHTITTLRAALLALAMMSRSMPARSQTSDSLAVAPPIASATSLPLPKIGGYIQAREIAQERVGLTAVLNRARFSIDGALPARFAYRALVEMQASAGARSPATVSLREAIVRWSPSPFTVAAGEFKTPFTREY